MTNGGSRRAGHRRTPVVLLALLVAGGACAEELGPTGVELELVTTDSPLVPTSFELRWYDRDNLLFPLRVPETGKLDPASARRANVLIEIDGRSVGERRVVVRGMREGMAISEAATKIMVERGFWTLVTLTMTRAGSLPDDDGDGLPNNIDNCPRIADPCDGSAPDAGGRDTAPDGGSPDGGGDGAADRPDAGPGLDGSGTGLTGEYFGDENLTRYRFTRDDRLVDFDWGVSSPDPRLNVDRFSVRWTGQLQARTTEPYKLYTQCDEAVRVTLGTSTVIDYLPGPPREQMANVNLGAGQKIDVRIEYFEVTGEAFCRLMWSSPSITKQIIPTSHLYPATARDGGAGG